MHTYIHTYVYIYKYMQHKNCTEPKGVWAKECHTFNATKRIHMSV